jgi:hypothetical protein
MYTGGVSSLDLTLQRDRGLGVVHVQAESAAGVDFVDAYTALDLEVVDSGQIMVPLDGEFALLTRAGEHRLTVRIDPDFVFGAS